MPPTRLTLVDEALLKFLQEFQVEQILGRERLLPHHCLHGLHVLPDGVAGVLGEGGGGDRQSRQAYRRSPVFPHLTVRAGTPKGEGLFARKARDTAEAPASGF